MIYKLTTGAAAIILAAVTVTTSSHPVAASCAVASFLALMLFAGSVIEGITKK